MMAKQAWAIGTGKTYSYKDGNETVVVYCDTPILKFNQKERSLKFNSGGFRTTTTKKKINEYAERFSAAFDGTIGVFQKKGEWYITFMHADRRRTVTVLFQDGMVFQDGEFFIDMDSPD